MRYVPELKNSLIPLGVLDSSKYKVILEDGVMKIVSSVDLVVRGIRKENLCFLHGHIVVRITSIGNDKRSSYTSQFWNLRFGKVTLQDLRKQVSGA